MIKNNAKTAALIASKLSEMQMGKESRDPQVILCGGLAIDIIGRPTKITKDNSNIGNIELIPGGCSRNIAECLQKLGFEKSMLISAVGNDVFGKILHENMLIKDGIFISKDHRTATYMCIMQEGDQATGVSDMSILEKIPIEHFKNFEKQIKGVKILALDANLSFDVLEYLFEIAKDAIITFDPISEEKCKKLVGTKLLSKITLLKGNRKQMKAITGITDDVEIIKTVFDLARGPETKLKHVLVTSEERVTYGNMESESLKIIEKPVTKIESIIKAGGAGDALLGGIIFGIISGYGIEKGIEIGMKCAQMSVISNFNIHPELSISKALP